MDFNGKVLMNKYIFGQLLGQGNFAKVYHGRDLKSDKNVAIKVIDKARLLNPRLNEQTKREISAMRLVKHPNVVKLYEVMATKTKIYIIMEYVKGGDLFKKVSQGKLDEKTARKYFIQLINAIDVCHTKGVYHRDLKLENLLIDENENLKVSDFGLSAVVESKWQDGLLHTTCGTPGHVAPEVINTIGYDGVKADIWSCGVILFVMLAGYRPFPGNHIMQMYLKMSKADYTCPIWFPKDLCRLLNRILDPNPYTRTSIPKIRNSSWFNRSPNFMSKSEKVDLKKVASREDDSLVAAETKLELFKPQICNAFHLISFWSGFSLSGMFMEVEEKDELQFTSSKPVSEILSKFEDILKDLKMQTVKNVEGLIRFEGLHKYIPGRICIDLEIFEISQSFHMVVLKKSEGDSYEYQRMLKEDIRPALEDIVCAWQGGQQAVSTV